MRKSKTRGEIVKKVMEGYNDLILDEITTAVEFARKYSLVPEKEIIGFGQDRVARLLKMRDEAVARILK